MVRNHSKQSASHETHDGEAGETFTEDPRYKQCNKEALICLGLGILNVIWWFAWGYGLGGDSPSNYTYVLGFPLWFFMSSIVGALLFSVLAVIMVKKTFKNMPLGKLDDHQVKEMQEEMEQ